MERFIRLNRSILDCDLAKGGWRLDEEAIAAIEDADRLARALRSAIPYREGPTEMQCSDCRCGGIAAGKRCVV